MFIFCQTPTFIDHVLWTFVGHDETQCGHWHYYYTAIGDLLAILNSSVNFVVYVVASPKFRRGLSDLLCKTTGSDSNMAEVVDRQPECSMIGKWICCSDNTSSNVDDNREVIEVISPMISYDTSQHHQSKLQSPSQETQLSDFVD